MTLTLNTVIHSFLKTLKHNYDDAPSKFGCERISSLEDI